MDSIKILPQFPYFAMFIKGSVRLTKKILFWIKKQNFRNLKKFVKMML